jgi:hypothetical protein
MGGIMRKVIITICVIAFLFGFSGCSIGNPEQSSKEVFTAELVSDRYVLGWEGKTYHSFGNCDDGSAGGGPLVGEKFARVDDGTKSANSMSIYQVNGYPPEDWVIFSESNFMGGYTLYKVEIPIELSYLKFIGMLDEKELLLWK